MTCCRAPAVPTARSRLCCAIDSTGAACRLAVRAAVDMGLVIRGVKSRLGNDGVRFPPPRLSLSATSLGELGASSLPPRCFLGDASFTLDAMDPTDAVAGAGEAACTTAGTAVSGGALTTSPCGSGTTNPAGTFLGVLTRGGWAARGVSARGRAAYEPVCDKP